MPNAGSLADFDRLHSRVADDCAIALGFDLLMLNGDDLRRRPLVERKAALGKLLFRSRGGIQYVEHAEGPRRQNARRRLRSRARGHRLEKARRAVSLRPVEKLDQGQESEVSGGHARTQRDVLSELSSFQ